MFECILVSPKESVSVLPSMRPCVGPSFDQTQVKFPRKAISGLGFNNAASNMTLDHLRENLETSTRAERSNAPDV